MGHGLKRDTATFLDVSYGLLEAGYAVKFQASGGSMRPAIRDGETITVKRVDPASVKKGDILLCRHGDRPIAHRVVGIREENDRVVEFILRGDAKAACDAPVKPNAVLGKVLLETRRTTLTSYIFSLFSIRLHQTAAPRARRIA